ncbi:hypothetical protein BV898_13846 [Hypsibius exemplaris]|uniref:Uncharacterized protein n=1 Tax=Hypsibius exemplaris TaxID=2072580 RepID=A0A1W0W9J4_HYPEX|nr:hypothetical protein BV898_13846 [Hypsibius exemplaris]
MEDDGALQQRCYSTGDFTMRKKPRKPLLSSSSSSEDAPATMLTPSKCENPLLRYVYSPPDFAATYPEEEVVGDEDDEKDEYAAAAASRDEGVIQAADDERDESSSMRHSASRSPPMVRPASPSPPPVQSYSTAAVTNDFSKRSAWGRPRGRKTIQDKIAEQERRAAEIERELRSVGLTSAGSGAAVKPSASLHQLGKPGMRRSSTVPVSVIRKSPAVSASSPDRGGVDEDEADASPSATSSTFPRQFANLPRHQALPHSVKRTTLHGITPPHPPHHPNHHQHQHQHQHQPTPLLQLTTTTPDHRFTCDTSNAGVVILPSGVFFRFDAGPGLGAARQQLFHHHQQQQQQQPNHTQTSSTTTSMLLQHQLQQVDVSKLHSASPSPPVAYHGRHDSNASDLSPPSLPTAASSKHHREERLSTKLKRIKAMTGGAGDESPRGFLSQKIETLKRRESCLQQEYEDVINTPITRTGIVSAQELQSRVAAAAMLEQHLREPVLFQMLRNQPEWKRIRFA